MADAVEAKVKRKNRKEKNPIKCAILRSIMEVTSVRLNDCCCGCRECCRLRTCWCVVRDGQVNVESETV